MASDAEANDAPTAGRTAGLIPETYMDRAKGDFFYIDTWAAAWLLPERIFGFDTRDVAARLVPNPVSRVVRHFFNIDPSANNTEMANLVALQRMSIHCLRKRLLNEAGRIFETRNMVEEDSRTLAALMQDYCNALRDREFMRDWGKRDWFANPFVLNSRRETERQLLTDLRRIIQPTPVTRIHETVVDLPGGPYDSISKIRSDLARYFLSFLGAVGLLVPIKLMASGDDLTGFIHISICTLAWSIFTAWLFTSKSPLELMSATATYTAVLVAFVGSSTGQGSLQS